MEPTRRMMPGTRPAQPGGSALNQVHLDAGKILRYLIGDDDQLDTLITCNPGRFRFVTTDQELYHAIGSIKEYDTFRTIRLSKLLEAVSVRTVARKQLLTDAIVGKLRAEALRK